MSYEEIRFKEDTFAEIALTGSFSNYSRDYEKTQLAAGTPELTNIGSYEKCWRIKDDGWWLYESGTPLERFSELFIAKLGGLHGFSMAEYLPDGEFVKTSDFTKGTLRACIHKWECRMGEGFSRRTRRFDAGILCVFQGKATQYGGKRPAQTAFHACE